MSSKQTAAIILLFIAALVFYLYNVNRLDNVYKAAKGELGLGTGTDSKNAAITNEKIKMVNGIRTILNGGVEVLPGGVPPVVLPPNTGKPVYNQEGKRIDRNGKPVLYMGNDPITQGTNTGLESFTNTLNSFWNNDSVMSYFAPNVSSLFETGLTGIA
jgi:hypothetical protein